MKFQSLTLQNYGSFSGTHPFRLADRGLVLVLGINRDEPRSNSNGAGKSTPWESLDWALFGKVPRDDHSDSVVNDLVGQDCAVRVDLIDDAGRYVSVIRWRGVKKGGVGFWPDQKARTGSGLGLWIDREDRTTHDTRETQRLIEQILGMDRDVFHAAVLFAQGDSWRFADGTDAERMDILTKVLQLGEIDVWLEQAKKLHGAAQGELDRVRSEVDRMRGQRELLQREDYQRQIDAWEAQQAQKIATLTARVSEAYGAYVGAYHAAQDPAPLQDRVRVLEASRPVAPHFDDSAYTSALAAAREAAGAAAAALRIAEADEAEFLEALRSGGVCPRCRQPISSEHVQAEQGRLGSASSTARARVTYAQQAVSVAQANLDAARERYRAGSVNYQTAAAEHGRQLQAAQQAAWAAHEAQGKVSALSAAHQRALQDVAAAQGERNPHLDRKAQVEGQLAQVEAALIRREAEQKHWTERVEAVGFWVTACGPKGLKSYVLDYRLGELTEAANRWIKLLTGGTYWVRFETQVMGRSTAQLSNKINVRVFNYASDGAIIERNYRSWSGGQRARVSMGVDFGLSRLIAARATRSCDLLVLDEVFKHLDRAGREAVVELLHDLAAEKSSIFVVDHDAEFQGQFDNVLQVEFSNRTSRFLDAEVRDAG